MAEINYEIIQKLGMITQGNKKFKKQVTLISWGEGQPKIDIRAWSDDYEKMTKGISLSKKEALTLREILNSLAL